jgi:hypothetical protein
MIFKRGYFKSTAINETVIRKSLDEVRNFSASKEYTSKPTVFLSHKHDDDVDKRGAMGLLENHGAKVYIDTMDNTMPGQTCGDTAKRIKEIIKFCNKFIFLATERAIESYWCNWELGIGDTHKYINHIAIIPIKEEGTYDSQYKGNEYLTIYPSIDYEDGTSSYRSGETITEGYYVVSPTGTDGIRYITKLDSWLKQK